MICSRHSFVRRNTPTDRRRDNGPDHPYGQFHKQKGLRENSHRRSWRGVSRGQYEQSMGKRGKTATKRHMRKSSRRAGSSRPQAPIRNSSSSTATTTSTIQTASTSPAAQPSRPACQPRLGHACGRRAGGFRAQLCRRRAEPHGAGLCRLRTPTHLMGNETCKVWAEGAMTKTTGDERSAEGLLMEVLHATGDRRHDPRRLDRPFGNRAD